MARTPCAIIAGVATSLSPSTFCCRTRPGGRSAHIRAVVLEDGLAELASVGFHAPRLERIAKRAGVNKTTLYRRWGTREVLMLEAITERASVKVPIPDTGSLRGDLLIL